MKVHAMIPIKTTANALCKIDPFTDKVELAQPLNWAAANDLTGRRRVEQLKFYSMDHGEQGSLIPVNSFKMSDRLTKLLQSQLLHNLTKHYYVLLLLHL